MKMYLLESGKDNIIDQVVIFTKDDAQDNDVLTDDAVVDALVEPRILAKVEDLDNDSEFSMFRTYIG